MKTGLALLAALLFIQDPDPAPAPVATGVIRGTVVNAITGTPLQGAVLRVAPGMEALASITSTTGSDGHFELTGLPDGQYELEPIVQSFVYSGSNRGSTPSRGRIVSVENGRRVENIRIGLFPALSISGKILDENGRPAVRKSVGLSQKGYQADGSPGLTKNTTARPGLTDNNGDYRIQNVLPGEYYIVSSLDDSTVYYPGVRRVEQAVPVVVSNTDIVGLNFPLLPTAKYSVRLRVSGVTPIPEDFTFRIRRGIVDPAGKYTTLRIPEDGIFKLIDLLPGPYSLNIQWYEEQPAGASVNPVARVGQIVPFDVVDRDVDLGTVEVKPRSYIEGQITFKGPTLSSVNINLNPNGTEGLSSATSGGYIGENNHFSISNVTAGRYTVSTSFLPDDGYLAAAVYNGVDVLGKEFTVDGGKDGRLDVVLDAKAGSVDGVVRDAKGDPFGDAALVLLPPIGRRDGLKFSSIATSDQDGKFSFKGVAPGDYSLFAWEFVPQNAYRNAEWLKPYELRATRITVGKGAAVSVNVPVIPRDR